MWIFIWIIVAQFYQTNASNKDSENTRIKIKNGRNYGTSSNQNDSNNLVSNPNPFLCMDTARIIMSFLCNSSDADSYALGLTNRQMFGLFDEMRNLFTAKLSEIYRMKDVSHLCQILGREQECFDQRMLKKRLSGMPCYFYKGHGRISNQMMNDSFSNRILNKMKNEKQFRIVRLFDVEADVNYFGAIISGLPSGVNDQFFVFKFIEDDFEQIFCTDSWSQGRLFEFSRYWKFVDRLTPRKTEFFGDLLLDDEFKCFVLSQSKNAGCVQKGVRKLTRRYLIAAFVTAPTPWIIDGCTGDDGVKFNDCMFLLAFLVCVIFGCRLLMGHSRRSMLFLISAVLIISNSKIFKLF